MSLEIRELIIKVNIEEGIKISDADLREQLREMEAGVIERCFEKVLKKLERSLER